MLRIQTGLDGETVLDITPRHLVVPAALETLGEQHMKEIAAAQADPANPFPGRLELVVVP